MRKKIQSWLTFKHLSILLLVLYLVSLIPMLWIGIYNYPTADDYSIGSNSHQAWVASHSLFQVLYHGILRAIEDWKIWMGYFTSNFLMAIPPSVFGERFYALTTAIMVGAISLSTAYLLHQILVRVLGADKYITRCITWLMLLFTMQCMVGRVEAFYWYCGAANYMLTHAMAIWFYGRLISLTLKKERKKLLSGMLTAFLGFLVGGGNQMTALNAAIILAAAIVWIGLKKSWKANLAVLLPMLAFYVGFILNIAAPGNWVRAEGASGMNPIKAVFISLLYSLEYCLSDWTDWTVLVMFLLLIPLFWRAVDGTDFSFPYPLIVVLFSYGLVSAMMTPPLFAVGNLGAARLQAVTFTMYMLLAILCEGYVIGWFKKRYWESRSLVEGGQMPWETIVYIGGCAVFLLFGGALTVISEPHYYTSTSALTDLANGSAKEYGKALEERSILYNSGEKDIVVEPLPTQPVLLYFSDITTDEKDWQNRGLCRYYGLNSVVVRKQP